MNTTKALSDEQIEEARIRRANGERTAALAEEFHVSKETMRRYILGADKKDKPDGAAAPAASTEPASEKTDLTPESDDALDVIYNLARGIEIFVRNHTVGAFSIHVSRENESTTVTAVAGDKEITIKHREQP